MSEQIETYKFHGEAPVRVVTGKDGEPWFVAKDVCDILGTRTKDIRSILDEDEIITITNVDNTDIGGISTVNGGRAPLLVSEPGLYKLVMRSRKPEAHEFQRWVTHEVLPSIRKHGGYLAGQEHMTPEQMVLASMRYLESKINEQQAQLEAQKPKVLFADAVGASDDTVLVGQLARMLTQAGYPIGQNRLFRQLRDDGFLCKNGNRKNLPQQRYMDMGLFRIKETAVTFPDGHVKLNITTKVTGKGQRYLIDYYTKGKAIADATVE